MQFEVAWAVTGSSSIEITADDLEKAGVDARKHSDAEAFRLVNEFYKGDLDFEVFDNWFERDRPQITFVESMDYYNAQNDEYDEEDSDG